MTPLLLALLATSSAGEPTTPDYALKNHMDQRFAVITDALWATFRGDLDDVQKNAAAVASIKDLEGVPAEWQPRLEELKGQAKVLEGAEDLKSAATQIVAISNTCSGCHTANDGPKLSKADLDVSKFSNKDSAMDRHQWATYMLWIGLVAPSDESWNAGIKLFSHEAGAIPKMRDAQKLLEEKVHDIAASGARAKTREEKGKVFVDLVTTCAQCHGQMGVKIK